MLLGHTRSHHSHSVHSLASSTTSSRSGSTLTFERPSDVFNATFVATSPTLSGSSINAPSICLLTSSETILSASSSVLSGSPRHILSVVAITTALFFWASSRTSVRIHCSSTIITSATPLLMNLSCFDMGPTILAFLL